MDHISRSLYATIVDGRGERVKVANFYWEFQSFKKKLQKRTKRNPSKSKIDDNFEKLPTSVSKGTFTGHTGQTDKLDTSTISVGTLGAILNVFDDDIKQVILDELKEIGVEFDLD